MGLLRDLTEEFSTASPEEARILRGVVSCMIGVDGTVAPAEKALVEAFEQTIPQLRDNPRPETPPQASRERMLEELKELSSVTLRKQCFVLCVELALSAGGIDDAEDAYLDRVRGALRLDEPFCRHAVAILAHKYACSK